jgi:hypothetical protein
MIACSAQFSGNIARMYEADGSGKHAEEPSFEGPVDGPQCAEARELEARIAELAGTINIATAGLVDAVARVIELKAWAGYGYRSAQHWVSLHAGVSGSHAQALVLMAQRSGEFPCVMGKFREGRLSEDQVRPIVRHVPAGYDVSTSNIAEHMAVSQLERTMRRYAFDNPTSNEREGDRDTEGDDPTGSDENGDGGDDVLRRERDRHQSQFASFAHDSDSGLWRLRAALSPEQGEIVATALKVFRGELFNCGEKATWHAALVRLAEVAMAAHGDAKDRKGHDRYQVLLHVRGDQLDALTNLDPTPREAYFHLGPAVSQPLARYMCCDASVRLIINRDGRATSVGRKHRTVPDHTRLAVEYRDGGACVIPGCGATRGIEVHHLRHWEDGGPTDTWNLACVCGPHHRAIHRGEIIASGNADTPGGLSFTNRWGTPLTLKPPKPPPDPPTGTWHHPTGESLRYDDLYINPDPNNRGDPDPPDPPAA